MVDDFLVFNLKTDVYGTKVSYPCTIVTVEFVHKYIFIAMLAIQSQMNRTVAYVYEE